MADMQINIAPFKEAMALKNAIMREIKLGTIDLTAFKNKKIEDILKSDISPFLDAIIAVDSSEAVNSAIMGCLVRCTYQGEKIIPATFDSAEAREDYYLIVFECLKVNLMPFFKGLSLKFNETIGQVARKTAK